MDPQHPAVVHLGAQRAGELRGRIQKGAADGDRGGRGRGGECDPGPGPDEQLAEDAKNQDHGPGRTATGRGRKIPGGKEADGDQNQGDEIAAAPDGKVREKRVGARQHPVVAG